MKIPESFYLGGIKWRVKIKKMDSHLMGMCYSDAAVIDIDKKMKQSTKELVFCHELVHAMLFSTGDNSEHDETKVQAMAVFLHQFLTQYRSE